VRKPDFTATATLREDCPCRREHREPLPYAPTGTADGGSLPQFAVAPNSCRTPAERLLAQAAPWVPAECVLRAAIEAHMRAANPTGQPPPRLGGGSVAPGCWASESKGK